MIYSFDIDFQVILATLFQFFLHKFQFLQSFTGQTAQAMKNAIATRQFNLKIDLISQQFLNSY